MLNSSSSLSVLTVAYKQQCVGDIEKSCLGPANNHSGYRFKVHRRLAHLIEVRTGQPLMHATGTRRVHSRRASKALTCLSASARAKDSCAAKVLFPTPPFPDSTRTLCLTVRNRSSIAAMSANKQSTGLLAPCNKTQTTFYAEILSCCLLQSPGLARSTNRNQQVWTEE